MDMMQDAEPTDVRAPPRGSESVAASPEGIAAMVTCCHHIDTLWQDGDRTLVTTMTKEKKMSSH